MTAARHAPGRVLLTGFDPFNGASINPSWQAVQALHGRQIQGRRGLLFGVQSPDCNAEAIVEHIQVFLQDRSAWLRELRPAARKGLPR